MKVSWATIILVIVGIFANPQSAQLKRWAAKIFNHLKLCEELHLIVQMPKTKPAWEKLELIVAEIQKQLAPDAQVHHNHRVIGNSGRRRKLDVTISQKIAAYPVFIVFDCKRHKRPVSLRDVGAFAEQLEDVNANLGVMVSSSDFNEGAKAVAARKNIILQTYRKAEETDWKNLIGENAWATFLQVDMINPRAFANLKEIPFRVELPIDGTVYGENSEVIGNLKDIAWDLWKKLGHTIGDITIQLRPEERPFFVKREKKLYQVLEFSVITKFVAKKYLINLHLAGGSVLENIGAEKPIYREMISKSFDYAEIVKNQPGVEISQEEYQEFRTKPGLVDLSNAQRFLRMKIIARDEDAT